MNVIGMSALQTEKEIIETLKMRTPEDTRVRIALRLYGDFRAVSTVNKKTFLFCSSVVSINLGTLVR